MRKSTKLALLVVLVMVTASCGSRVPRSEVMTAAGVSAGRAGTTENGGAAAEGSSEGQGAPSAAAVPEGGAPAGAGSGDTRAAGSPSGATGAASRAAGASGATGGGSRPTGAASGGSAASQSPKSGNLAGPSVGARPATASEIVLGSVGTQSGPAGTTGAPLRQGMQVWVKDVNARGGINGHPVRWITYDDGGDPARHRASTQQAVERDHVVGFLMNFDPFSGHASAEYIRAKRVPVIGAVGFEVWATGNPMYFPQGSYGDPLIEAALAAAARVFVPQGKKKLGWLVCVEVEVCRQANRVWSRMARSMGFEPVYQGQASFTQPDYTAECVSARSAGAEVLYVILDPNGVQRVASSCARQNYRPSFATPSAAFVDRMKEDPNLDGLVSFSTTFLYFQRGTTATDDFHRAMRQYGSGITPELGTALAWAAAKLFEKAAAGMPEPPTSEALLQGLWSIKGDALGGLTQPLTFVKDQPAQPAPCWFALKVEKGAVVSPDGFKLNCM